MNLIKAFLISLIVAGTMLAFRGFDNATPTTEALQSVSVMIHGNPQGNGSGTIIGKADGVQYVITAYHVVDGLKKTDGTFDVIPVSQKFQQDNFFVGHVQYLTELVRYSEKQDIAVLRIIKKNAFGKTVRFSNVLTPLGSPIRHVGCFHGDIGYNSYSEGVLSQTGRTAMGSNHIQISAAHYPGSSGGGVYNWNGEYIGMVLMRHDATFGLANPIEEIRAWGSRAGLNWLFINGDYSPSLSAIKSFPLKVE